MEGLTNIFTALSFVEDDADLNPVVNPSAKSANSKLSFQKGLPAKGDRGGDKREGNSAYELHKPLVWIDLEMTGLNLETDQILEIACIVTDGRLEKIIEGPELIIHQPEDVLARMNEWCQEQHTASGLVDAVRSSTVSQNDAEKQVGDKMELIWGLRTLSLNWVLDFVSQHVAPGRGLLSGNSVYVDLMFLRKHMPRLAEYFPHVLVDVSSLRALCVRWYPRDADKEPPKKKTHRALEDIKESIEQLRYMQGAIFKRPRR